MPVIEKLVVDDIVTAEKFRSPLIRAEEKAFVTVTKKEYRPPTEATIKNVPIKHKKSNYYESVYQPKTKVY